MRTQRAKAFTLVELLVVIAIIALLLAVLMPTLGRVKFRTRLMVCTSNVRTVAVGMGSYASSFKGRMPRQDLGGTGNNLWDVATPFVDTLMQQYNVPLEMFFCPTGPAGRMRPGVGMGGYEHYGYFRLIGYMLWVPRLNGGRQCPPDSGVIPDDLVRGPVGQYDSTLALRNPVFTDLVGTSMGYDYNGDISVAGEALGVGHGSAHMEGSNVTWSNQAFIDGSAYAVRGNQLKCRYGGNWWNWR